MRGESAAITEGGDTRSLQPDSLFFLAMSCNTQDLNSLTMDQTCAPSSGNAESQPLDCQEGPRTRFFKPTAPSTAASTQLSIQPHHCVSVRAFLVAHMVKNLPAKQENWVQSLGQEDLLEKEMATHPSILAWRIPRTEEPGGL